MRVTFLTDSRWKYFTEAEVAGLDYEFITLLDRARAISMTPYVLTSTLRDAASNERAGGSKNSSHLKGLAVDIRCRSSVERFNILKGLFAVGFCRIGIYLTDGHVHVDDSHELPQGVVWLKE